MAGDNGINAPLKNLITLYLNLQLLLNIQNSEELKSSSLIREADEEEGDTPVFSSFCPPQLNLKPEWCRKRIVGERNK